MSLDAHVHGPFSRPDATGRLEIDKLTAGGASVSRITADIAGNAGRVRLKGELAGLRVPGPDPDLLAADPLTIEADVKLDEPDRPVHVSLHHKLFTLEGRALTGADRRADATLLLADLTPFAAIGQVPLQGQLALNLHAATDGDATTVNADGTIGVTGGQPQASALVGDKGRMSLAATVRGNDVTLSSLRFSGRAASFGASGQVAAGRVDGTWSLAVNDLAAAEPHLGGQFKATGTVAGRVDDLRLTADITGSVAAQGMSSGALDHQDRGHRPAEPSGRQCRGARRPAGRAGRSGGGVAAGR